MFVSYSDTTIKNVRIAGYKFAGASSVNIGIQSIFADDTGLHVNVKNYANVQAPACDLTVYYF